MRIIFCGAQGTGKSTLARELKKIYPSLEMIDSVADSLEMKKENFKFSEPTLEFQTKLSVKYFDLLTNTKDYISSRGLPDIFAYSHHNKKRFLSKEKDFENLENMCLGLDKIISTTSTFLFYVPIMFDSIESKDLRSTNKSFQYEIDIYIRDYLRRLGYISENKKTSNTYTCFKMIESLSVEDRLNEIEQFIKSVFEELSSF